MLPAFMCLLALLALPFLSHPKSLSYSHVMIFLFMPMSLPQGPPRVTPSFLWGHIFQESLLEMAKY